MMMMVGVCASMRNGTPSSAHFRHFNENLAA
jgi:hypothetical protein